MECLQRAQGAAQARAPSAYFFLKRKPGAGGLQRSMKNHDAQYSLPFFFFCLPFGDNEPVLPCRGAVKAHLPKNGHQILWRKYTPPC